MPQVFFDLAKEIEFRKFKVYIPEFYEPSGLHPYFTAFGAPPIYETMDYNMTISMLTAYDIVKAVDSGVPVWFMGREDMLAVESMLKMYCEKMSKYREYKEELDILITLMETTLQKLDMATTLTIAADERSGKIKRSPYPSMTTILSGVRTL